MDFVEVMKTQKKMFHLSLHIFRRDLRLEDNMALIDALKQSECVIPCFIFDKRQIEDNPYKSLNSMQFMANSLYELDLALQARKSRLYFFYGYAEDIVKALLSQLPIDAIFHNRDYTPFSCQRDKKIENICQQNKIAYRCYADALLHEPEEVLKPNHKPYTVFTPFFRKASSLPVNPPLKNNYCNYYNAPINTTNDASLAILRDNVNPHLYVKGGREEALTLLSNLSKLHDYNLFRDYPEKSTTSKLSAHVKFGTISVREFFYTVTRVLGPQHILLKQLQWRDFFTHIGYFFPHVFHGSFHQKFDHLPWSNNKEYFHAWCNGKTGFPIVDAGMRELNMTGYMHNRVRMIAASFLTKDLHIHWKEGEKYFANHLVDYDPAINNGSWQWAASTGCDAQPYFRIFNPWIQQKKFDFNCLYIKHWVRELADIPSRDIHLLYDTSNSYHIRNYPAPIIDHAIESEKSRLIYKKIDN